MSHYLSERRDVYSRFVNLHDKIRNVSKLLSSIFEEPIIDITKLEKELTNNNANELEYIVVTYHLLPFIYIEKAVPEKGKVNVTVYDLPSLEVEQRQNVVAKGSYETLLRFLGMKYPYILYKLIAELNPEDYEKVKQLTEEIGKTLDNMIHTCTVPIHVTKPFNIRDEIIGKRNIFYRIVDWENFLKYYEQILRQLEELYEILKRNIDILKIIL